MKKFLFILLLLPAITALGHDIYFFTQNQDKGFRLSDLGKLWDTYHKESHDQWKVTLDEISDTVNQVIDLEAIGLGTIDLGTIGLTDETSETEDIRTRNQSFTESFSQEDGKEGTKDRPAPNAEPIVKERTNGLKNGIGFLLEQKAVFVLGAVPAIIFILNLLISLLCGGNKSSDTRSFRAPGGQKTYKRK